MRSMWSATATSRATRTGSNSPSAAVTWLSAADASRSPIRCAYAARNDCRKVFVRFRPPARCAASAFVIAAVACTSSEV